MKNAKLLTTELIVAAMLSPVIAALMSLGCVDTANPCGPMPLAPGTTVAFDRGLATMSAADWSAMLDWRRDIEAWGECVSR